MFRLVGIYEWDFVNRSAFRSVAGTMASDARAAHVQIVARLQARGVAKPRWATVIAAPDWATTLRPGPVLMRRWLVGGQVGWGAFRQPEPHVKAIGPKGQTVVKARTKAR
jgi:hypothetical protein